MKFYTRVTSLMIACACMHTALANEPSGAGATFPYPVIAKWSKDYAKKTGQHINYQGIGSSAGINQLKQATLDFSASDKPQTIDKLNKLHWLQFPAVISGIVPIVNIQGVGNNQLILSGDTLADIFLGKIQFWDNARIQQLNPKLPLPHKKIITVHRADGSGTTFNFTHYLSQVSPEWKQRVGYHAFVKWPTHYSLGAKGNGGVASQVKIIPNSIGYVEYSYAKQENLAMTQMKNRDAKVVKANLETFAAAASHAHWQKDQGYYLLLTNQPGDNSWPIDAASFALIDMHNPNHADIIKFFSWAMQNDAAVAKKLGYVVAPQQIIDDIKVS